MVNLFKTAATFGWSSDFKLPPEPEIFHHEIEATFEQTEQARFFNTDTKQQPTLFVTQTQGVVGRSKLSQIAKGFVYLDGKKKIKRINSAKPEFVASLIEREVAAGLQVLVWTIFDEETEIIAEILGGVAERRADLESQLKIYRADYAKTERQMFDEIPLGAVFPSLTARKKEFDYLLQTFGDEIKRLEAELGDLQKSSGGGFARGQHFEVLSGATPAAKRGAILDAFRQGETPVLISKASLLGYGMNFQMCGSMIFSGWNDSFESFYQAVGRAVRYGQEKSVRIHLPFIRELEYAQLENIFRKQDQFEAAILEQEKAYIKAMKDTKLI